MTDKPEPPALYNHELERSVLGALIIYPELIDRVDGALLAEHFHERVNGVIYTRIGELTSAGKTIGLTTLKMCLTDIEFAPLTPAQYLGRLVAEATTVIALSGLASAVMDLYKRRRLMEAAEKIKVMVSEAGYDKPIAQIIDEANGLLEDVQMRDGVPEGVVTYEEALSDAMVDISKSLEKGGTLGLSTGFPDLDAAIGGLKRSEVIVIGGRPGMGKTAIAMDIVDSVSGQYPEEGKTVFFSQEMKAKQLATRRLSKGANVSSRQLNNADLNSADIDRLKDTFASLKGRGVLIDPVAGITLAHMNARLRQISRRNKMFLVVIDYLQLLKGGATSNKQKTRVNELTEITAGLKVMAKEFDVCVLVVAQLRREQEPWNGKKVERRKPTMTDLKDSSSIEQDADIIVLLHREEYYLKKEKPNNLGSDEGRQWQNAMNQWKGLAEAIVDKNRNGEASSVLLGWDGHLTSFRNLDDEEKNRKGSEHVRAKILLTNDAGPVYRAIQRAIADMGKPGQCQATDQAVVDYHAAFTEYFRVIPLVGVDDIEALEKKERTKFREAALWLRNEKQGLLELSNYELDGEKRSWIWLTDRGVRT